MHYLSACHTERVWRNFRSWIRTIRSGVAPTEMVVKLALRNELPELLLVGAQTYNVAKFIVGHQRLTNSRAWAKAARYSHHSQVNNILFFIDFPCLILALILQGQILVLIKADRNKDRPLLHLIVVLPNTSNYSHQRQ
jgi:hypothetical protein